MKKQSNQSVKAGPQAVERDIKLTSQAKIHRAIVMDALDLEVPDLLNNLVENDSDLEEPKRHALQLYSGNWMRDFSQLVCPLVVDRLQALPKHLNEPNGEKIGPRGAVELLEAILESLAILELGEKVVDVGLVNMTNIGTYEPQEHIDNPMGAAATDFVVFKEGEPRQATDPAQAQCDEERDEQMAGASVSGLQFCNPKLYKTGGMGLNMAIFNSIEFGKQELLKAVDETNDALKRMHAGSGLHVIEDYFAHSNFIEVALNTLIEEDMESMEQKLPTILPKESFLDKLQPIRMHVNNQWIDSLYDCKAEVGNGGEQRTITTGTFGGVDTKVSIGHMLLPRLPALTQVIEYAIERSLKEIKTMKPNKKSAWETFKEVMSNDRPGRVLIRLAEATEDAQITVPALMPGLEFKWSTDTVFGRRYPVGVRYKHETLPEAINQIYRLYSKTRVVLKKLKRIEFVPGAAWIKNRMTKLFGKYVTRIRSLKQRAVVAILEVITGQSELDVSAKVDDVSTKAHEVLSNFLADQESRSSLCDRLQARGDLYEASKSGDKTKDSLEKRLGPLIGRGKCKDPWRPEYSLPPSHSELSKDHPPDIRSILDDQKDHPPNHRDSGSIFFGLHKALALTADRHILMQLQKICPKEFLAGDRKIVSALNNDQIIDSDESVVLNDARAAVKNEKRKFTQSKKSFKRYIGTDRERLMNLVDVFLCHPGMVKWWREVVINYVKGDEKAVLSEIKARNQSRRVRKNPQCRNQIVSQAIHASRAP